MTKKDNLICRSFRQDFPQFVERVEALGVRITLGESRRNDGERVFWLDGYKQLTGYWLRSDGMPFTRRDAENNIDKVLTQIKEDRVVAAKLSIPERFARVMAEFRKMSPQYRMIGEVRQPNGDRGHCFFMATYDGCVRLEGIGEVAEAKAKWRPQGSDQEQMTRFCDMLEADFARRQAEASA